MPLKAALVIHWYVNIREAVTARRGSFSGASVMELPEVTGTILFVVFCTSTLSERVPNHCLRMVGNPQNLRIIRLEKEWLQRSHYPTSKKC